MISLIMTPITPGIPSQPAQLDTTSPSTAAQVAPGFPTLFAPGSPLPSACAEVRSGPVCSVRSRWFAVPTIFRRTTGWNSQGTLALAGPASARVRARAPVLEGGGERVGGPRARLVVLRALPDPIMDAVLLFCGERRARERQVRGSVGRVISGVRRHFDSAPGRPRG